MQQTNRFNVLDRDNMAELQQEAAYKQQTQAIKGANYVVTGDVTEVGRKEVGDHQLFGIMGRGKTQVAYAKVTLNGKVLDLAMREAVDHLVTGVEAGALRRQ